MVRSAGRRSVFIHPSLANVLWFGNDNCQKPCDVNPEGSEWLSIAQCGFDSGFRRPPDLEALFAFRALLCH